MKKSLFTIALLLACLTMAAQNISGSWNGKLPVGPQELTIVLNVSDSGCTLDSPDQGAKGIPCKMLFLSADSISVDVPMIGASYAGRLSDGKLVGKLTQMGYSFPLDLQPGEAIPERPQTPQPPYGYETREVTFTNEAGDATLAGTLSLPEGCNSSTPVVLMVSGSGLQNRDEEIFDHKPFAVIADHLARHGIASLRYDDRSCGKSTGDASKATTADFGNDAAAGIKYLKGLKQFGKVGVLGHSEGGLIAFSLAASGDVDFAITLASPAMRGDSLLVEQNRLILQLNGTPATYANTYTDALAAVLAQRTNPRSTSTPQAFIDSIAANLPEPMRENLVTVLEEPNVWLDYWLAYSPRTDIAAARCPVMAIAGSKDIQVAPSNLAIITSLLPQNQHNRTRLYDGLNHLFQHCTTGSPMEYNAITETTSPEVLNDIAQWLLAL